MLALTWVRAGLGLTHPKRALSCLLRSGVRASSVPTKEKAVMSGGSGSSKEVCVMRCPPKAKLSVGSFTWMGKRVWEASPVIASD